MFHCVRQRSNLLYGNIHDVPRSKRHIIRNDYACAGCNYCSNRDGIIAVEIFIQFLYQARGSLYEVMTLLKIALRLQYLKQEKTENLLKLCNEIAAKTNNLISSLKK